MNPLIKTILSTNASASPAIPRVTTGFTLMSHDLQKLFGMLGGAGLNGMVQWFEPVGLTPGYLLTTLAGNTEFFGGLALVIDLLMRPTSMVVGFTMIVAVFSVHIGNDFSITDNGYRYILTLPMISVALLIDGAGKFSLDGKLSRWTELATKKGGHLRVAALSRYGTQRKVSTSPATPGLHP